MIFNEELETLPGEALNALQLRRLQRFEGKASRVIDRRKI
jgi:hypothetical protein